MLYGMRSHPVVMTNGLEVSHSSALDMPDMKALC